jgi:hypothetical protein
MGQGFETDGADGRAFVGGEGGADGGFAGAGRAVDVEIEIWVDIVWDDRAVNCRSDGGSCLKRDWAGKLRESGMRW